MSHKLRIQTLICSLIFSVGAMAVMLYYSANKMIVIADVAQDGENSSSGNNFEDNTVHGKHETDKFRLQMNESSESTNYMCVPLPEGLKAEQVIIENYYMNRQIRIFLRDVPRDFYENGVISGNLQQITSAEVEYTKEGAWLFFDLTEVYESRSILENNFLYVEFVNPREIYDKIVVIDAGHGGEDAGFVTEEISEREITIDIAQKLKDKLDTTDIKVYYTGMDESNPSDEERVHIANAVKADMFISIHVEYDEDNPKNYGTGALYNSSFFIPGFGSIELADLMERETVTSISGKGLGLFAADEECYILQHASVPATILQVGYLSNHQEAILLQKDDYRQRIADGIYNGIMKAFDE